MLELKIRPALNDSKQQALPIYFYVWSRNTHASKAQERSNSPYWAKMPQSELQPP